MRVTALPPEIGKLIALFGPSDGYEGHNDLEWSAMQQGQTMTN
jgi:hypothetical protein